MEIVYIGSIFCSLITALVLLKTQTTYQAFSDRLLAIFFLSASYCAFLYLLVFTDTIIEVPHFFKTAAPFNFIMPPVAYLYVRSVIRNETSFKKTDALHFIPFVIITINYIPFYFTSGTFKTEILTSIGANVWEGTGFINETWQFIFRELQSIIYLGLQWRLIIGFKKDTFGSLGIHTRQVLAWLRAFSILLIINFITIVFIAVIFNKKEGFEEGELLMEIADIIFGLSFFMLSTYLLVNPSVLYGLPFIQSNTLIPHKIKPLSLEPNESESKYEVQLSKILNFFEKEKPYRKKGLTISEVSVSLDILPRNISFILNNHLGIGFNDFVNRYRVKELEEKLIAGHLENYTLEYIAKEVGFSSARTLNRAFHKIFGITPSEYASQWVKK